MRYRSRGFQMNPLLWIVAANLAVFLVLLFAPKLVVYLGMIPAFITEAPWTIVTAMFAHSGFWHLFGNMITLFFFGRFFAQIAGDKNFLILYFGGGLLGNIFFLLAALFLPFGQPLSLVVGASGAVFALGGALTVLTPKVRVYIYGIIPLPLWTVVIFGFLFINLLGNIAWEAHLGGLLFGLGYGWYFKRQQAHWRW